jgi:TorA maturation chaperone TorD
MNNHYTGISTPDELLQAYTAMFIFLGGSVSLSPEESGLPGLCDSGMLRNLPVDSKNMRYLEASRLLRSPCPHRQQCHLTICNNYKTLLSTSKNSPAYPAATRWFGKETDAGEYHRVLSEYYSRYGYCTTEESDMEADHLGIQLLFVNLLIEKFLTEDDNEIREMIRKDLVAFIKDEMLTWLPRWSEKVSERSVTKCYTGISGLIVGGLEDVNDLLRNQKLGL